MTPPARGVNLPAHIALRADDSGAFHRHFDEMLEGYAYGGVTRLRLGFDWSRLQPRPGDLDGQWVEWYFDVITAATRHDIDVWASLLERSIPHWFDDERGFSDPKSAGRYWPRFVEACADTFGDRVAGWCPIDDPIGFAARTEPLDVVRHGELVDTMVVAWRDAWRILAGGPPVAGSFGVRLVKPIDTSVEAAEAARREDHLRWKTFLRGVRDGTVVIPGRADRVLADLAGAIDIVGIKLRTDLGDDTSVTDESLRRWHERASTIVHRAVDEGPDKPLAITFHASRRGMIETDSDRNHFTDAFERAANAATVDGLDITTVFTTEVS